MASITINATFGNGLTLQKFGEILQQRMQYLHQSARDAIAASAIQILRGIRTVTKVAKASKIKVKVKKDDSIFPSCTSQKKTKLFCIRYRGSKERYNGDERIVKSHARLNWQGQNCYRFVWDGGKVQRRYIIVASSESEAKDIAKKIVTRRAMAYAGLAKRALSRLMMRTVTKPVNDGLPNPRIENVAMRETTKQEQIKSNGETGTYSLILLDSLKYALKAVKGGKSTVDIQTRKALNKITSVINQKLKKSDDFFSPKRLETPFPEVKQRKKS